MEVEMIQKMLRINDELYRNRNYNFIVIYKNVIMKNFTKF